MRLVNSLVRRKSSNAVASLQVPEGLSKVFEGSSDEELERFVSGKVDGALRKLLLQELEKGETVLGSDKNGELLRVVSVAKPIILDTRHGEILVEVLQTALGNPQETGSGTIRMKGTGMSEKFNPLKESSREACSRALKEELQFTKACASMFSSKCLKIIESANSDKFQGLKSEYHLYVHMLKPSVVSTLQSEVVPRGILSRVDEHCELDPRSLWWAWVSPQEEEHVTSFLAKVSKEAGLPELPLQKIDKFGNTPAGTIRSQMDMAMNYLETLME